MVDVTTADEIEFLDDAVAPAASFKETVDSSGPSWRWLATGALFLGIAWFVSSTGTDDAGEGSVAGPPSTEPQQVAELPQDLPPSLDGEIDEQAAGPIPAPVFNPWPSPPIDRDPYVVRIPGPVELPPDIAASLRDSTSIVYVNTAGDPTLVSFVNGDVYEIDVAATRVHETFAVENGRVASLGGANAALDDATDQAIIFHTYRDVDRPGVGPMGDARGVGRGPELCLSASTCVRAGIGLDRLTNGGLVAERFDANQHWAINDLLENWEVVDRWLVSEDGYRFPIPVGLIWVVGPPRAGSPSSVGLL